MMGEKLFCLGEDLMACHYSHTRRTDTVAGLFCIVHVHY